MRKHGISNFILEVITTCETRIEAVELEKFWISKLNSMMPNGYNMTSGGDGGNTLSGWTDSQKRELYAKQTKSRKGKRHSDETKRKISEAHRGKTIPIEQRLKLSDTMKFLGILPPVTKGKIPWIAGKKHTCEARKKISESKLGKSWETLWSDEYIKERKSQMSKSFSGENNPKFIEFSFKDKIKILNIVSTSFDFYLKDSRTITGFSEYRVRELFREVGITNFQSFKKANKENWKTAVQDLILRICSEGEDVSEILGIVKYEPPVHVQLAGQVKGNFPSLVSKTEEERVQNIRGLEKYLDEVFVETEKLHGTSVSFVLNENSEMEVCSRNLSLKEDENNLYWKLAKKNDALSMLKSVRNYYEATGVSVKSVAIQGEGVGQGVQKGWEYGIQIPEFFLFTIQVNGVKIAEEDFQYISTTLGVKSVPEVSKATLRQLVGDAENISSALLKRVEGRSLIDGKTIREGSVFRCFTDSSFSFKVVNNQFLLKGGD